MMIECRQSKVVSFIVHIQDESLAVGDLVFALIFAFFFVLQKKEIANCVKKFIGNVYNLVSIFELFVFFCLIK